MSLNKKSDFQLQLRLFDRQAIKNVWYSGEVEKEIGYHSVSKSIYIQFENNKVYCFGPADEFRLKLGYGISFQEMKHWDREKKYIKPLINVSTEWGKWIGQVITKTKVQWFYAYRSRYFAATHYQTQDFPLDIHFRFESLPSVYLSVTKIWEEKKADISVNHLTIFFDEEVKRKHYEMTF